MRPALGTNVSSPSSALLRFLRKQNEEIFFFTANFTNDSRPARASLNGPALRQPASARGLTTSRCHQATVESNIFNFDFLRSASLKGAPKSPVPEGLDRYGIPVNYANGGHRHVSTDNGQWKRWWAQKSKKEKGWRLGDLPPMPSFLDEMGNGHGRSKTGKVGNELRLRCTEIDEHGNVTTVNGEFKKSELMDKVGSSIDIKWSQRR